MQALENLSNLFKEQHIILWLIEGGIYLVVLLWIKQTLECIVQYIQSRLGPFRKNMYIDIAGNQENSGQIIGFSFKKMDVKNSYGKITFVHYKKIPNLLISIREPKNCTNCIEKLKQRLCEECQKKFRK